MVQPYKLGTFGHFKYCIFNITPLKAIRYKTKPKFHQLYENEVVPHFKFHRNTYLFVIIGGTT